MKDTLDKYTVLEESKIEKISKLLLLFLIVYMYIYIVMIWAPGTYAIILQNTTLKYLKIIASIVLSIYITLQIDINYVHGPKYGLKQIKDYESWNKFLLHFAFLKTGSSNEREQVLEVLRYLEDSRLKQSLIEIFKKSTSLKDAHNVIVEMYPYPQVKTFFSETEDTLVRGVVGKRLIQKTALNVDKYVEAITIYNNEKLNSLKVAKSLLWAVVVLTLLAKIGLSQAFIDFTNTYTGVIILIAYFVLVINLFVDTKRNANREFIRFGGESNEKNNR